MTPTLTEADYRALGTEPLDANPPPLSRLFVKQVEPPKPPKLNLRLMFAAGGISDSPNGVK